MRKISTKFIAAIALLALTACSGVNREAALELATAGETDCAAMLAEITTQKQITERNAAINKAKTAIRGVSFRSEADILADLKTQNDATEKLLTQIALREKMVADLGNAYKQFAALSSENAGDSAKSAFLALGVSTDEFLAASQKTPLSEKEKKVFDIFSDIVRFAVGQKQEKLIKNANVALAQALDKVTAVLASDKTELTSASRLDATTRQTFAQTLIDNGYIKDVQSTEDIRINRSNADAEDRISELIKLIDTPTVEGASASSISPDQRKALAILTAHKQILTPANAQEQAYQKQLDALNALRTGHSELNKNPNMSFEEAWTMLEGIVKKIRQLEAPSASNETPQ